MKAYPQGWVIAPSLCTACHARHDPAKDVRTDDPIAQYVITTFTDSR